MAPVSEEIERLDWSCSGWSAVVKPAGMPVFPPHKDPGGDCVLHRLGLSAEGWPEGFAGGIAHRLDVPTSGLLLVADTPEALPALRECFSGRRLRKNYRFITAREVPWQTHTVNTRIAHDRRRRSRMVIERGRNTPHRGRWLEAETTFLRLGQVPGGWLWQATMSTGVMHQIRVHAASVGLALAGDRLYGGGEATAGWPVAFALHHVGVEHEEWGTPRVETPAWWP